MANRIIDSGSVVENNFGNFVRAQLNFTVASTDNRAAIAIYPIFSFSVSFPKANIRIMHMRAEKIVQLGFVGTHSKRSI